MHIVIDNKFRVFNPESDVVKWVKDNMTFLNPEYISKYKAGFYTGNTPQYISLYEIKYTEDEEVELILPYGTKDYFPCEFLYLAPDINTDYGSEVDVEYNGKDLNLFDYQQEAFNEMLLHENGILIAPAGSGKTQMGLALAFAKNKRTLWIAHTLDLVKQSYDRASKFVDSELLGLIKGGKVEISKGITFATVQTLSSIDLNEYADYWDTVIVDECHRVSGSPSKFTMYSKVLNTLKARHKYGLTATFHRSDGFTAPLSYLLGDIKYTVPQTAVSDRVLPVSVYPIITDTQLNAHMLDTAGMLDYSAFVNELAKDDERNAFIAHFIENEKDKVCIVLSDRVSQLEAIINMLPLDMKSKSALIVGKTKAKDRDIYFDRLRSGQDKYLFSTYALAKEGLDIPIASRLFLATPKKDKAVIVQSIGRVARVHPDKPKPICYDFVDNAIPYAKHAYVKRFRIYKNAGCNFIGVNQ